MKSVVRLTLTFADAATAQAITAAVSLDDEGYIKTTRQGRTLVAEASADTPMALLHTLDDYLACVSVAERTTKEARPPGRARRRRA
ncbi:MAG: KEOPS complex subunit Pcc1 [Thermoplasmata archaeon]